MAAPIAALAASRLLLSAAALGVGHPPLDPATWIRADSGHYLSIAAHGYEFGTCAALHVPLPGWCGNAGWMPAYPAVVALVVGCGVPDDVAGLLVSEAFGLALLVVLWNGILQRRNPLALLACALVPGAVYLHAVFPLSLCASCLALCLHFLLRDRYAAAGLAGAVAAAAYPSGFLIAPIATAWALSRPGSLRQKLGRAALAGGLAGCGLLAVFALHHVTVGAWNAYMLVQQKYRHHLRFPLLTIWEQARGRGIIPESALFAPAVTAGLCALGLWRGRSGSTPRERLLFGCAALFWVFPLSMYNVGLERSGVLIFPALVLLGDASPRITAAACVALAALGWWTAQLFFTRVLV